MGTIRAPACHKSRVTDLNSKVTGRMSQAVPESRPAPSHATAGSPSRAYSSHESQVTNGAPASHESEVTSSSSPSRSQKPQVTNRAHNRALLPLLLTVLLAVLASSPACNGARPREGGAGGRSLLLAKRAPPTRSPLLKRPLPRSNTSKKPPAKSINSRKPPPKKTPLRKPPPKRPLPKKPPPKRPLLPKKPPPKGLRPKAPPPRKPPPRLPPCVKGQAWTPAVHKVGGAKGFGFGVQQAWRVPCVFVGDRLWFEAPLAPSGFPTPHNVNLMPSQAAYDSCSLAGATYLGGANYTSPAFATPGVYYYACLCCGGDPFHCLLQQKVAVRVYA